MSCTFSRELLALHAEGDLPGRAAAAAAGHLDGCAECRRFLEELRAAQSLLKSLRLETIDRSECREMRHQVMSVINGDGVAKDGKIHRRFPGWMTPSAWVLPIERAIVLGLRRPSYALATFVLLGIVSISALAQMRSVARATTPPVAVFEGRDTLVRPDGYREWTTLTVSAGWHPPSGGGAGARRTAAHTVYIDRLGYRVYVRTGAFPEGTLMLWESAGRGSDDAANEPDDPYRPHGASPALLASVKDSTRFDGRWGFFDFTGSEGTLKSRAQPLPESSGCRRCHRHT